MSHAVSTHKNVADLQLETRSTARAQLDLRTNTLGHESTVLAGMRELNEDTALVEADLEKYWDAPSSSFRDLDDIE